MKTLKPIVITACFVMFVTLLIPSILVLPFSAEKSSGKLNEHLAKSDLKKLVAEASTVQVSVFRTSKNEIEKLPLEQYVVGVVASEMPADFEHEALKAQSLTARTYIVRHLLAEKNISLPKGADVGDTQLHQVYKNDEDLKKIWGSDYNWKINKIRKAVYETKGQIIVYNNQPITAAYFSTSNGYTENSEYYWTNAIPYLKSVASPWDLQSPKYSDKKVLTVKEFEQKLGVKLNNSAKIGEIVSRTPGNRVAKVNISGKEFTGREIREKLELRSTDFTWERKGDQIIITTKGFGHGVGMSQYGANGMAKEGKTYKEIIQYYYKGVEITEASKFLNQQVVKK